MIGKPITWTDGGGNWIDFTLHTVLHGTKTSVYQGRVNPIVELPGGATVDVWEGNDLPPPRLMPVIYTVLVNSATWETVVSNWQSYQGRYGTLTAKTLSEATTETVSAYFDTINVVEVWNGGCVVDLRFIPDGGDWS